MPVNPQTHSPMPVQLPGHVTVFAPAAYTASQNGEDVGLSPSAGGLIVDIDVTAQGAAPSVVFTIQGKDPVSGTYNTLLVSAAIVAPGHTKLMVSPNLTAVANLVASSLIPETVRVIAVAGNGDSLTYSVALTCTPQ